MNRLKKRDENQGIQKTNYTGEDRRILQDIGCVDENTNTMQSPVSQKSYSFIHNHSHQNIILPQKQLVKPKQQNLEDYFQVMKKKLQTIFKFYASFGDRINVNYLKSNKLHKMLLDAAIKNVNGFDGKQVDIMYSKINRNRTNMDFESFLQMLHHISEIIYPSMQLADGLTQLLSKHFEPLYENIISQTDLGDEETKFQEAIEQPCLNAISHIHNTLLKIFQAYFPQPHKEFKLKEQQDVMRQRSCCESQLFMFLKDFDICPTFITKSSAYLLLNYIVDQDGKFPYNKFCKYLCKVSFICYDNYHEEKKSHIEMLAFLLERMELSAGFNTLESKVQLQLNAKLKLSSDVIQQVPRIINNVELKHNQVVVPSTTSQDENSLDNASRRLGTVGSTMDNKFSRSVSHAPELPNQSTTNILSSCQDTLMQIYRSYCGINQVTCIENQLSGSKWHKLLKDANLVQDIYIKIQNNDSQYNQCRVPYSEIDLMYSKVCCEQRGRSYSTQSSKGKQLSRQQMNFQQFLSALHLLSQKLYSHIDQTEAIKYILNEHILPLGCRMFDSESQMKMKLTMLMTLLNDPQIVELLGLLHKSLLVYFRHYSNQKGLISFEKFLRFYKEFDIFPDLLPKSKIINIFQTLAKLYDQNSDKKDHQEIDQHMFIESFALTALEIPANQDVGNLERVLIDLLIVRFVLSSSV